jgi:hypothetical protein
MIRQLGGQLAALLHRIGESFLTDRVYVRGLPVRIVNTRHNIDPERVIQRLGAALDLISTYAPQRFRRLKHDFAGLVVRRFPCRGAFFPEQRECLVELTFTVNPQHTLPEIAASIVHEATHARVARMCGSLSWELRAKEERLCRKAELEFGLAVPDGQVVVQRARDSLTLPDRKVAPVIDWALANSRVAEADARTRRPS